MNLSSNIYCVATDSWIVVGILEYKGEPCYHYLDHGFEWRLHGTASISTYSWPTEKAARGALDFKLKRIVVDVEL